MKSEDINKAELQKIFNDLDHYQNWCPDCQKLFDTRNKYRIYCYDCTPSIKKKIDESQPTN